MMGTFFPPETYFAPQSFSLQQAGGGGGATLLIGRIGFFAVLIWLSIDFLANIAAVRSGLRRALPVVAFAAYALITAWWAADFNASFNRSARMLIIVFFACYLVHRFDVQSLLRLLTRAFGITIVCSLLAVVVMPDYAYSNLNGYRDAWRGAFIHKNSLGATMSIGALVALYSLRFRINSRLVALGVLAGCLFLLLMSRSATALVAAAATVPVLYVLENVNRARSMNMKLAGVIFGAIVLGMCTAGAYFADDLAILLGRDPTLTGRRQVWDVTSHIIGDRALFGWGHAFWGIESPMRAAVWNHLGWAAPHAHNTWLDVWLQLGGVGLSLAAVIFVAVVWRSIKSVLIGVQPVMILWPLLIANLLVRSVSETTVVEPAISGIFWLTIAYGWLARLAERPNRAPRPRVALQKREIVVPSAAGTKPAGG
jgi:exopolysaccharide production protein ExoQ